MKIAKTAARRKASPVNSTDSYVINYLGRRFRLRRLAALIVAAESGLGSRP
jgi:hypothetical protein